MSDPIQWSQVLLDCRDGSSRWLSEQTGWEKSTADIVVNTAAIVAAWTAMSCLWSPLMRRGAAFCGAKGLWAGRSFVVLDMLSTTAVHLVTGGAMQTLVDDIAATAGEDSLLKWSPQALSFLLFFQPQLPKATLNLLSREGRKAAVQGVSALSQKASKAHWVKLATETRSEMGEWWRNFADYPHGAGTPILHVARGHHYHAIRNLPSANVPNKIVQARVLLSAIGMPGLAAMSVWDPEHVVYYGAALGLFNGGCFALDKFDGWAAAIGNGLMRSPGLKRAKLGRFLGGATPVGATMDQYWDKKITSFSYTLLGALQCAQGDVVPALALGQSMSRVLVGDLEKGLIRKPVQKDIAQLTRQKQGQLPDAELEKIDTAIAYLNDANKSKYSGKVKAFAGFFSLGFLPAVGIPDPKNWPEAADDPAKKAVRWIADLVTPAKPAVTWITEKTNDGLSGIAGSLIGREVDVGFTEKTFFDFIKVAWISLSAASSDYSLPVYRQSAQHAHEKMKDENLLYLLSARS